MPPEAAFFYPLGEFFGLERARFAWPRHGDAMVSLSGAQLNILLDGYDLWRMGPHRQVRYASMY